MDNNEKNETYKKELYNRRDLLKLLGIGVTGGAAATILSGCQTVNKVGNEINTYLKDGLKYGAIDDYINSKTIAEGDLGKIVYGLTHYPPDFVFDIGRAFKSAFYDVPQEAMRRAIEEKYATIGEANAKKSGKESAKLGPVELLWDAGSHVVEFVSDAGRFVWNYGEVSVEGMGEQITKRPLETAAHGFWTWFFTYLSTQHGEGVVPGAVEDKPPKPSFPKPP